MSWIEDTKLALKNLNKPSHLKDIYTEIESIRDVSSSNSWQAITRRVLETNSSDSNTSSPDGTYTVSGNGITIDVVVTGDKWTRISNNKVETGVVSAGYLYDEYQVNKIGEIYGDGTINFKGTTLSK